MRGTLAVAVDVTAALAVTAARSASPEVRPPTCAVAALPVAFSRSARARPVENSSFLSAFGAARATFAVIAGRGVEAAVEDDDFGVGRRLGSVGFMMVECRRTASVVSMGLLAAVFTFSVAHGFLSEAQVVRAEASVNASKFHGSGVASGMH